MMKTQKQHLIAEMGMTLCGRAAGFPLTELSTDEAYDPEIVCRTCLRAAGKAEQ